MMYETIKFKMIEDNPKIESLFSQSRSDIDSIIGMMKASQIAAQQNPNAPHPSTLKQKKKKK
jgi:hypothetical protein